MWKHAMACMILWHISQNYTLAIVNMALNTQFKQISVCIYIYISLYNSQPTHYTQIKSFPKSYYLSVSQFYHIVMWIKTFACVS